MGELRSILYIEDDDDIREVASLTLRLVAGFEVLTAAGGEEGIVSARTARPDLILLDRMMPGLDGIATLARLRADPETAAIPVIFLTARSQQDEIEDLISKGAAGVVGKPFDPMTLGDSLREIWGTLRVG